MRNAQYFFLLVLFCFASQAEQSSLPECIGVDRTKWSDCFGKHTFSEASKTNRLEYIGEFKGGKLTGNGTLKFRDGSLYEGDFLNDERHGQGIFIFSDGSGIPPIL